MNAHNDGLRGSDGKPHSDATQPIKTPPMTDYERLKRLLEHDRMLDQMISHLKARELATKPVNFKP